MNLQEAEKLWHDSWIEAGLLYRDLTHLEEMNVAWLRAGQKLDNWKRQAGTQAEDLAQHCFAAAMADLHAALGRVFV